MELATMISSDYAAVVAELNKVSKYATCIERTLSLYVAKPYLAPFAKLDMPKLLTLAQQYLEHCKMLETLKVAKATGDCSNVTFDGWVHLMKTFDEYYHYSDDAGVYRNGRAHELTLQACNLAHPEYLEATKLAPLDFSIIPNPVGNFWRELEVAMPTDMWSMLFDVSPELAGATLELRLALDAFAASVKNLKSRTKVRFIHTKGTNNKTAVLALTAEQKRLAEVIFSHREMVPKLPSRVTAHLKHICVHPVIVPEGTSTITKSALVWVRGSETNWGMIL